MRALKTERFAPKGKWTTTVCIGFISFLTLAVWIPTVAWPMYNRCFASLIWFPMRYDLFMLVLLIILVGIFLLLAAIISIQLMRTANVDPNQRIAASRMCYYLLMAALLYVRCNRRRNEMKGTNVICRPWSSRSKYKPTDKTLTALTPHRGLPRSLYSHPAS